MGSAAGLGASLTLMSIGATEIDPGGNDVADLGIDAIRLVTGPSRIGCRIHTNKGVDPNDFRANRIRSARFSTDRAISADRWCERLDAAFSIVLSPPFILQPTHFPRLCSFEHLRLAGSGKRKRPLRREGVAAVQVFL